MKISDRDKKIIVIILIAAVIALPYLFIISPTKDKQEIVEGEIATLDERLTYLEELNANKDFYLEETQKLNNERDGIIANYAEDIRQENIIMFLRGIELDEDLAIKMKTLSFAGNTTTPLVAGATDEAGNVISEEVNGISTQTSVAYECGYENMKLLLNHIKTYSDRMVLSAVDMTYNGETGKLEGMFVLDQYAITTPDRELEAAKIPAMDLGNDSIFGTYITNPELLAEMLEAEEGGAEGEETEETEETEEE